MKLVVAIVHNEDAGALVDALLDKEFRATRVSSSGGFLKQSNATIFLDSSSTCLALARAVVKSPAQPPEITRFGS